MAHRVAPEARGDLDGIWYYIAKESGSVMAADRMIDTITDRFHLLGQYPRAGRRRDDLGRGLRSYSVGEYLIIYVVDGGDAMILHVFPARRDIPNLIGAKRIP